VRTVTVRIVACDLNTTEGAVARLSAHPDIAVLARDDAREPDVLLAVTTQLTETTLCGLELASVSAGHPPRLVLVVERIEPWQLDRAMAAWPSCLTGAPPATTASREQSSPRAACRPAPPPARRPR
jgi:hypothetical protein